MAKSKVINRRREANRPAACDFIGQVITDQIDSPIETHEIHKDRQGNQKGKQKSLKAFDFEFALFFHPFSGIFAHPFFCKLARQKIRKEQITAGRNPHVNG